MPQRRPPPSSIADREIDVEVSGEGESPVEGEPSAGGEPKAFTLRGHRHAVVEVVSTWHEESFGGGYRRDAWLGHQRVFYRVRTETGELFDIYFDVGERQRRGRGRWVMHRRLAAGEGVATTPVAGEPQHGSEETETAAPDQM